MRAAALATVLLLAAGCASPGAGHDRHDRSGSGADPSLPGVTVRGNATWDGDSWRVSALARNEGTRTFRVATGCDSPFSLEARAERGEPYGEARCLAYTEPVAFPPGQEARRSWDVDPRPLGWDGQETFTVAFEDAEGLGEVRVALA